MKPRNTETEVPLLITRLLLTAYVNWNACPYKRWNSTCYKFYGEKNNCSETSILRTLLPAGIPKLREICMLCVSTPTATNYSPAVFHHPPSLLILIATDRMKWSIQWRHVHGSQGRNEQRHTKLRPDLYSYILYILEVEFLKKPDKFYLSPILKQV